MRCPLGHRELEHHSRSNLQGIGVTFDRCSQCGGYWTSGFDANYIDSIEPEPPIGTFVQSDKVPKCPECGALLGIVRDDSVPPDVAIYRCGQAHGYFFPHGQLEKFKAAREARIRYHKLWNIPLPALSKVLLTCFIVLAGTALVLTSQRFQQTQQISTQAKDVLTFQEALYIEPSFSLVFLARTSTSVAVTLHIDTLSLTQAMISSDGMSHSTTVHNLQSGSYEYYFTYSYSGNIEKSEIYKVEIP